MSLVYISVEMKTSLEQEQLERTSLDGISQVDLMNPCHPLIIQDTK